MFDTALSERLNREGYSYLFEGVEQINIKMKLEELQFHVTSYDTAPLHLYAPASNRLVIVKKRGT